MSTTPFQSGRATARASHPRSRMYSFRPRASRLVRPDAWPTRWSGRTYAYSGQNARRRRPVRKKSGDGWSEWPRCSCSTSENSGCRTASNSCSKAGEGTGRCPSVRPALQLRDPPLQVLDRALAALAFWNRLRPRERVVEGLRRGVAIAHSELDVGARVQDEELARAVRAGERLVRSRQ